VQVLKEGSQRVRSAILQDLGPGLPSREAVASIQKSQRDAQMQALQQQAGINPEDDSGTRLRKLLMMNQKQSPAKEPAAK
jgi:predicted TPR repeat methyltransferase